MAEMVAGGVEGLRGAGLQSFQLFNGSTFGTESEGLRLYEVVDNLNFVGEHLGSEAGIGA